jgi:esterase/lipase
MYNNEYVDDFCSPPLLKDTDFDMNAFQGAKSIDVEFEKRNLRTYIMGNGPDVILVHGWGSRASHMSLLARFLSGKGYRVTVFDCPAHGFTRDKDKDMSSMFEFGRALSYIASITGNIYAVIGHSLGGIASALTLAGTGMFRDYKFLAEKLVLISSPESMSVIIDSYCKEKNDPGFKTALTEALESAFSFKVRDYDLTYTLGSVDAGILIIHDEDDEEIPVSNAYRMKDAKEGAGIFLTKGFGHQKILINRSMLKIIGDFLSKQEKE